MEIYKALSSCLQSQLTNFSIRGFKRVTTFYSYSVMDEYWLEWIQRDTTKTKNYIDLIPVETISDLLYSTVYIILQISVSSLWKYMLLWVGGMMGHQSAVLLEKIFLKCVLFWYRVTAVPLKKINTDDLPILIWSKESSSIWNVNVI